MSNVRPRVGGPYGWSLYCYECGEWVVNTANAQMRSEGAWAHSHVCKPPTPADAPAALCDLIPCRKCGQLKCSSSYPVCGDCDKAAPATGACPLCEGDRIVRNNRGEQSDCPRCSAVKPTPAAGAATPTPGPMIAGTVTAPVRSITLKDRPSHVPDDQAAATPGDVPDAARRRTDDSDEVFLGVTKCRDGTLLLSLANPGGAAIVQFCPDGASPRTFEALKRLMAAMDEDNCPGR